LKRLSGSYYLGQAYVHWSMTIDRRKTGWLCGRFHDGFRMIMAHTMFRYGLCCPIYCCMPDHLHLLWIGVLDDANQLLAVRTFRLQLNRLLAQWLCALQRESYDHVLREEERERGAFEQIGEYIARNPERKGLVATDGFRGYPYTGCVVPGYPELDLWAPDYWSRFWRCCSYLRKSQMFRARASSGNSQG